MLMPVQVTFRQMRRSDGLEAEVQRRAAALERYWPAITACRVMLEPVSRHRRDGNQYHVRIDLTVPGGEIVVSRVANLHGSTRDRGASVQSKGTELDRSQRHVQVLHV